jgi:TP901 family phage tail tape measure protein
MADIKYLITADSTGAVKEIKAVDSTILGVGKTAKEGGSLFSGFWKQIAAGIGITALVSTGIRAIKGAITSTITEGRNFEREWANTTTMLSTSAEQTDRMKKALLNLSPTLGSSTDLAKGLYQVLSASIPAGEAVQFLGEAAKSAKAGLTDTYTAVDALTTVINAYGMSAKDVTGVSDIMFEAVKRGKLTYEEMAGSLGTVVPIAAQVGIGFDEISAAMSTLTRVGVDANTATVQLRQILINVLKPSKEAADTAKALGLEFNVQALQAKGLAGFLADVREKTGDSSEAMSALFGNARSVTGAMALAGKQAQAFKDDLKGMADASGKTDEAFRKQMDSMDFWIGTLNTAVSKWKIAFYNGFTEPLKKGIKDSKELELQLRITQERFEETGRKAGETFKFLLANISAFQSALKGPTGMADWAAKGISGITGMKEETLKARVEAEMWAESLTNLQIPQEELEKRYGKNTEAGKRWREEMERLNEVMGRQPIKIRDIGTVSEETAAKLREQVNEIMATSTSSEEAAKKIRELRESMGLMKAGAEEGADSISKIDEAAKKYKEKIDQLLESLGVSAEKNRELIDTDRILHDLYETKTISLDKFNKAHAELVDKMFEYGEIVPTAITETRQFGDITGQAALDVENLTYGIETDADVMRYWSSRIGMSVDALLALIYQVQQLRLSLYGITLPDLDFGVYSSGAEAATKETKDYFVDLYNDIATGFGNTVESYISGGMTLKNFFNELCQDMKKAFFRMIGEMVTGEILKKFQGLFSSIFESAEDTMKNAAESAVDKVKDITKGASSVVSGLWTALGAAVGSFIGTLAAGLITGGGGLGKTEGHWIHEIRDRAYDICNWLNGVGKSIETGIYGHFEKFDGIKGSIDETREALGSDLGNILNAIREGVGILGGVKSAQSGFEGVVQRPTLFLTHPQEYVKITPAAASPGQAIGGERPVMLNIEAHNYFKQVVIERDNKYVIDIIQEKIEYVKKQYNSGNWKIPITSVGGA